MSNVKLHPFGGSNTYCTQCNLPKKNTVHQNTDTILIQVTAGGNTTERWTTEFTEKALIKALDELLVSAVLDDSTDVEAP